ncbi:unnamed protein product, partial [Gordionus sp. m RMFG-2023]
HNGAVFHIDIKIALMTIVTSSEDRSIIVWNIENSTLSKRNILYGHKARIHKAIILNIDIHLSAGEDGKIILWKNGQVNSICNSPNNTALSALHFDVEENLVYAASINGTLISCLIDLDSRFLSDNDKFIKCLNIRYLNFIDSHNLLITTYNCDLFIYNVLTESITQKIIENDPWLSSCTIIRLAKRDDRIIIALGDKDGILKLFEISINDSSFIVNNRFRLEIFKKDKLTGLFWVGLNTLYISSYSGLLIRANLSNVGNINLEINVAMKIHQNLHCNHLWVSALIAYKLNESTDLLFCGDRKGYLHLLKLSNFFSEYLPLQTIENIHGSRGLSDIQLCKDNNILYTTDRNGVLREYYFYQNGEKFIFLNSQNFSKSIEIIEKIIIKNNVYDDTQNKFTLLLGFMGRDFVCYNTTINNILFKVCCGGAHRSWDYLIPDDDTNLFLAFIKKDMFSYHSRELKKYVPKLLKKGLDMTYINSAKFIKKLINSAFFILIMPLVGVPKILVIIFDSLAYEIFDIKGNYHSILDLFIVPNNGIKTDFVNYLFFTCGEKSEFCVQSLMIFQDNKMVFNEIIIKTKLNRLIKKLQGARLTCLDGYILEKEYYDVILILGSSNGTLINLNYSRLHKKYIIYKSWQAHDHCITKIKNIQLIDNNYIISIDNTGVIKIWSMMTIFVIDQLDIMPIYSFLPQESIINYEVIEYLNPEKICLITGSESGSIFATLLKINKCCINTILKNSIKSAHLSKIIDLKSFKIIENGLKKVYIASISLDKKCKIWSFDNEGLNFDIIKIFDVCTCDITGIDLMHIDDPYIVIYGAGLELFRISFRK